MISNTSFTLDKELFMSATELFCDLITIQWNPDNQGACNNAIHGRSDTFNQMVLSSGVLEKI